MFENIHILTAQDIEGLDYVEIFMEAKGVCPSGGNVEIEGYGTFSYTQILEELSGMGY